MAQQQPARDDLRIVRPPKPDELELVDFSKLSRYDFLLAILPVILLSAWTFGQLSAVPAWAALGVGSLVVLPLLVDGLAVNPPT